MICFSVLIEPPKTSSTAPEANESLMRGGSTMKNSSSKSSRKHLMHRIKPLDVTNDILSTGVESLINELSELHPEMITDQESESSEEVSETFKRVSSYVKSSFSLTNICALRNPNKLSLLRHLESLNEPLKILYIPLLDNKHIYIASHKKFSELTPKIEYTLSNASAYIDFLYCVYSYMLSLFPRS